MKTYGLIGWPLGHSWSPGYFTEKFLREGIQADYKLFPVEHISSFHEVIAKTPNLGGLNVTIPHKTAVIPYLDNLSPVAAKIGAVNTIAFKNGKLIGHNTDAFGFAKMLESIAPKDIRGALILGTGGASKAVAYVLSQRNIPFLFVSRSNPDSLRYSDLDASLLSSHNLIINCTPVGMFPNVAVKPAIDSSLVSNHSILIDLIYNPLKTRLMQEAESRGAQVLNGLKMLQFQAEQAWEIWQA